MGFLGYDPTRLRALRRALDDLPADARRWSTGDALLASHLGDAQRAINALAGWSTRLDQILTCAFDSPYQPVGLLSNGQAANASTARLDALDARYAGVVRPWSEQWFVVRDPLVHADADLAERAGLLARWLRSTLIDRVIADDGDRAALIEILGAIARDPGTVDAFVNALGTDDLASLVFQLARMYTSLDPRNPAAQHANDVLTVLGSVVSTASIDDVATVNRIVDAVDQQDPTAAALFLRYLHLPADQLGHLVAKVWADALRVGPDYVTFGSTASPDQPSTISFVLDELARWPDEAKAALMSMDDDALDALLAHADGSRLGRVLAALGDPNQHDKSWSSPIVGRVLALLDRHKDLRSGDLMGWIGAMASPWLPELVSVIDTSSRYPLTPLDLHGRSGEHMLKWMARNEQIVQSMTVWMSAYVNTEVVRIAQTDYPPGQFGHLGHIVGAVQDAIRNGHLKSSAHEQWLFRKAVSVGAAILTSPVKLAPPVAFAAQVASNYVVNRLGTAAINNHVLGLRPQSEVEADEIAKAQAVVVTMMTTVVDAMYHQLDVAAKNGGPPAPPPPPAPSEPNARKRTGDGYHDDLLKWRNGLSPAEQAQVDRLLAAADNVKGGFADYVAPDRPPS